MSFEKYIPQKMRGFTPYVPIISENAVHMEANESPFDLPAEIKAEICRKLMSLQFNRYPDPTASALCRAFAAFYGIDPSNVAAGNGSDELIMVITAAFFEKGDRIAVASPDFSMYEFYSSLLENEVCIFDKGEDMALDLDAFSAFIKQNECKAAIFSNPCNPTGVLSGNAEKMRDFIKNTDALIILDEAYMDFSSEPMVSEACGYDNLILLKTVSKGFGLAGARLGFAVANDGLIKVIKTAKSPYNVNSVSQLIGETVLSHKELIKERHDIIKRQRDRIYSYMVSKGFETLKSDTNFIFVKTQNAKEICAFLRENGIVIKNFGGRALRITAGSEEETDKFIEIMDKI